jgi:hypothetical protein
MADNIKVEPSTEVGAVNVATDDVGGVHYPVYKTAFGVDGAATPVSKSEPLPVDCSQLAMGEIYEDATYKYFGEAQPGTDIISAAWRVSRMTKVGKRIMWADGDADFDNTFDDLGTVAAFIYS